MENVLDISPEGFIEVLHEAGLSRAAFVYRAEARKLSVTHPALEPFAKAISEEGDFAEHEGLFVAIGKTTGALLGAFVHRTVRGQAAGGVRLAPYATFGGYVRDGLRLARGMGRKNALSGIYWGGGKGVIARQTGGMFQDPAYRRTLYAEYGTFVSSLRGVYVTAEDLGTTPPDMESVFSTTRFTTCIPETVGGSGNPSPATARGVVCAMEGALAELGLGTLSGKTIAMQGAGNVGKSMIAELCQRGASRIVAADIDAARCRALSAEHGGDRVVVRHVAARDTSIFAEPCDVFAPNGHGGILNPDTIPRLSCRVVCGAANNQLLDEDRDDRALHERGITYVPDFVANRMGIVSCANEQYGSIPDDPLVLRHFGRDWSNAVYVVTRRILSEARSAGTTTTRAANVLADQASLEPHPLFPHRGRLIIDALVALSWDRGAPA